MLPPSTPAECLWAWVYVLLIITASKSKSDAIEYLKANGTLILCAQEVKPITASLGRSAYDGNECIDYLRSKVDRFYTIDVEKIIEECGTSKVLNVAVVGALCASGEMDLAIEDVDRVLGIRMKPKLVDVNRKALRMGAACIG